MDRDTRPAPTVEVVPPEPDPGPDPRRWLAFAVVLAAGFMDLLDTSIVNVTVPSIQHDLHAPYAQIEWIVSAYVLAFAAVLITAGRLGDIHGRKPLFLTGIIGFTIASLLCGISAGPAMLIGCRFAQGAFAGLMIPQILAILRVSFPPHERAKAVGIFGAVTGSSVVFGLALGGVLVQWNLFGWQWRPIFLINVPVGIAVTIAAWFAVRDSRAAAAPRLDVAGALIVTTAVALLVYPLTEGSRLHWPAWLLVMIAGSVLVFAAFVAFERRRAGRALVDFTVFRSRPFAVGLVMWGLFWIAAGGFFLIWTLFMQAGLGWTPLRAGLTAATFAAGVGVGAGVAPEKLVPRFGRDVSVAGAMLLAAGFAVFACAAAHFGTSISLWAIVPIQVVSGLGFGMVIAPTLALLLGQVPHREAGAASGLLNTVQQVCFAIGVALAALIFFDRASSATGGAEFVYAFASTLRYVIGVLVVVAAGFLAVPRAAHVSTALPESEDA
ncbi:MFS transporter [Nocardia aurantia]|uniref:Multidrug resistance protein Stp n=1 Tax=Nocardia aurantia TaxID=2585199 RepID=A0A7K0DM16_9NOCA|nr:MFS transporter [Nocardia aurantia]MQY26786.1 Multidrug resistance protein Stp [Nocardia aurantia]